MGLFMVTLNTAKLLPRLRLLNLAMMDLLTAFCDQGVSRPSRHLRPKPDNGKRTICTRASLTIGSTICLKSRLMWPTYEKHAEQVNDNLRKLTDKLTDAANRRLAR